MKNTTTMGIAMLLALCTGDLRAQFVEGFDGGGLVDRSYPHSGVALLDSFDFQFTKNRNLGAKVDHHLQQILVAPDFPASGTMRLGFHDKNKDDQYFYRVSHHSVTDSRVRRITRSLDICDGGKCTVNLNKPAGDVVFVLVGFQLSFRGTDHHIDEVGVLENDGKLTVYLNDKNDDDTFIFSVQFAWVPRDLFREVGESSGTRERKAASRTIGRGRSVMRGFKFDFRGYFTSGGDHHIRAISALTPDGRVEVLYTDQNGDDGFDWLVRWAILR